MTKQNFNCPQSMHQVLVKCVLGCLLCLRWKIPKKEDFLIVLQFLMALILTTLRLTRLFFLSSMYNKARKAAINGLILLTVNVEDNFVSEKPKKVWTPAEDEATLGISLVLKAFYNRVDNNIFIITNTCTSAKDAWKILEVSHKGISKFCMSILQLLTTKFKILKMREDENIYHSINDHDIANNSSDFDENMSDKKLVRKVLRSLSKRFNMRVSTIEETQNVSIMNLMNLLDPLSPFIFPLMTNPRKIVRVSRSKRILFIVKTKKIINSGFLVVKNYIYCLILVVYL